MSELLKYALMARACSPELANDICAKLDELAALKAQQPAAPAVPDGFVLVPVEPTSMMIDAASKKDTV